MYFNKLEVLAYSIILFVLLSGMVEYDSTLLGVSLSCLVYFGGKILDYYRNDKFEWSNRMTLNRDLYEFMLMTKDRNNKGLVVLDYDGYFLWANENLSNYLGYKQTEIIGKKYQDLVHKDDLNDSDDTWKQGKETLMVYDYENRYQHKDGHYVSMKWDVCANYNSKKKSICEISI